MVLHSGADGLAAQRVTSPVSPLAAAVSAATTDALDCATDARCGAGIQPMLLVFVVSPARREFTRTWAVCRVCTIGTVTPKLSRFVAPYSRTNGVVTMRASLRTSS